MGANGTKQMSREPRHDCSATQEARLAKSELAARRKSDPHKVALAREVRSQTTMSLKWIAQRLEMDLGHTFLIFFGNKETAIVRSED